MVDASTHPFEENIARTRAVVDMAHGCAVPVEGELGYVAGVEGEDAEKHPGEVIYTSPDEAAEYVERSGVDFLAVSIGTVHGRMAGEPRLDLERLAAIDARLGIPLVIHGGTGLSDAQFRALIARGVTKINYYTALADAAAACMRANAAADPRAGYTGLVKGVRAAIAAEVERCIELWGGAGQADAVLAEARPWREVEHLIVYNLSEAGVAGVADMMREGRKVLGAIPGVRRVFTGEAVTAGANYRYCWLVRFADEAVIPTYRDHPAHRAFADTHFRPVAGDRISIDYIAVEDGGPE
jgi:fructose-bisphosphate aldolase class II